MKQLHILGFALLTLLLTDCDQDKSSLNVIDSRSFPDSQITIGADVVKRLTADSLSSVQNVIQTEQNPVLGKMDEMIRSLEKPSNLKSDITWKVLLSDWEDMRINLAGMNGIPNASDLMTNTELTAIDRKWCELNVRLLKLSGEVRFGDALEKILYEAKVPVLTDRILKSIMYTHIDDQIYLNIFGSSVLVHHHTTGGIVKIIQETSYPASDEITLKCETTDARYLNVFIRIPSWTANPTVTHGNVKYVPHPGEYCQVSRMWKDGDEIRIVLKN